MKTDLRFKKYRRAARCAFFEHKRIDKSCLKWYNAIGQKTKQKGRKDQNYEKNRFTRTVALFGIFADCLHGNDGNTDNGTAATDNDSAHDGTRAARRSLHSAFLESFQATDMKENFICSARYTSEQTTQNNYPKQILDAFEKCTALAVESDIVEIEKDTAALIESMKPFVYSDGTTIKDHIDKELYDDAVALMTELGIYNFAMDYYKPTFWDSMISSMLADMSKNYKIDNGVDRWFPEQGKKNKQRHSRTRRLQKTYADEAALSDKNTGTHSGKRCSRL